jgi:hypothetical protein
MENQSHTINIPSLTGDKPVILDLTVIKKAESRLPDTPNVTPAIYGDLWFSFNEGYRAAKKNYIELEHMITKTEKRIRELTSHVLIDEYPTFLQEKKIKDSAAYREAFLETKEEYKAALDHKAMLTAMSAMMELKIKTFENACSYLRKQMDLFIRSGMVDHNKYIK